MQQALWLMPVSLFLFGLLFGSFANVVIWRFPRGESVVSPGSHCPQCDSPIAWYDNIPVVSWLVLRARCRGCGAGISWRYPFVELLSGLLWVSAWLAFGATPRLALAVIMFYMLLLLAFIDLDTMRLPNILVAYLAAAGLLGVAITVLSGVPYAPLIDGPATWSPALWAALGVVAGAGPALLMSIGYSAIRGTNGMGMGDVKLLAALGPFLGPYTLLVLFLGSVFGVLAVVAAGGGRSKSRKIPFGPWLALAGVVTAIVGPELVGWYFSLL